MGGPGTQPFTDYELPSLSEALNVMTGLVLRGTRLIAVIESLVQ